MWKGWKRLLLATLLLACTTTPILTTATLSRIFGLMRSPSLPIKSGQVYQPHFKVTMTKAWLAFISDNQKVLLDLEARRSVMLDRHPLETAMEAFRARFALPTGLKIDHHIGSCLARLSRQLESVGTAHGIQLCGIDQLVEALKKPMRDALNSALYPYTHQHRIPLPPNLHQMLMIEMIPAPNTIIPFLARAAPKLLEFLGHVELLKISDFATIYAAYMIVWKSICNRLVACSTMSVDLIPDGPNVKEPPLSTSSAVSLSLSPPLSLSIDPVLVLPKPIHLAMAPASAHKTHLINIWISKYILNSSIEPEKILFISKNNAVIRLKDIQSIIASYGASPSTSAVQAYVDLVGEASAGGLYSKFSVVNVIPSICFQDVQNTGASTILYRRLNKKKIKIFGHEDALTIWPIQLLSEWSLVAIRTDNKTIAVFSSGSSRRFPGTTLRQYLNELYSIEMVGLDKDNRYIYAENGWKFVVLDIVKIMGNGIDSGLACMMLAKCLGTDENPIIDKEETKIIQIAGTEALASRRAELAFELFNGILIKNEK